MPSPTGFSETTQKDFSYLGDKNSRALLSGSKWGSELGKAFTLTYSFPWTTRSDGMASWDISYTKNETTNFNLSNEPFRAGATNLNATHQAAVKDTLSKWSNVANVKFNYVAETATPPQVGDLRFAFTKTDGNEGGHAYLTSTTAIAGDVWLPSEQINTTFQNPEIGSYGYLTFLHEIGHALGLKHPFEDGYTLPADQDSYGNSIMSYNAWKRSDDPNHLVTPDFYPTTPMWYDIFAMQFLYGANNSYHTGDDVYTYRENEHYWETIWDAGGKDTINYIGSVPAKIDLRDGSYGSSDIGLDVNFSNGWYKFGTVTIFQNVIIENAYGGSGDDTLHGNNVDNVLDGYLGSDTAIFEGNKSDYKVQKVGDSYIVNSIAEGKDTLKNIEFVQFKDGTFAIDSILEKNQAPTGSVTIYGTIQQGQTLSISNSLTDADGLGTFSYQWFRGATADDAISGATQSTYTLTADDVGKKIDVIVGYVDGLGKQEGVFSDETALVTLPVNRAPTGQSTATFPTGTEDKTWYILKDADYFQGFNDPDGDSPQAINIKATNAKLTKETDGWHLVPNANFNGTAELTYDVIDNKGGSIPAKMSFVINPVNDVPTGYVKITGDAWEQGKTLTASNTVADADGIGAISYQWLSNGNVISGANQTTYLLTAQDIGKAISVKASYFDLQNTFESVVSNATSLVTTPVNHAPSGNPVGFDYGDEDTNYILDSNGLLNGFYDVDGDSLFVKNPTATHGKITPNTDGTWLLTPDANFNGAVQLSYIVSDSKGASTNATFDFILSPVIDEPTGTISIIGDAKVGSTLSVQNTLDDVDGMNDLTFTWLGDGEFLGDGENFELTNEQKDLSITVTASYFDEEGNYEEVSSLATENVIASNHESTGKITIKGDAKVGSVLSLTNTIEDADGLGEFSYSWETDNFYLSSDDKLTLTSIELGEKIVAVISYTDGAGNYEEIKSQPTAPVTVAKISTTPTT